MKIPYLIAVTAKSSGTRGIIFDRTQGEFAESAPFAVAWADGVIDLTNRHDLVFVAFLSSEIEANAWLAGAQR